MIPLSVPEISPCDGFCDGRAGGGGGGGIGYSSSWTTDSFFMVTVKAGFGLQLSQGVKDVGRGHPDWHEHNNEILMPLVSG